MSFRKVFGGAAVIMALLLLVVPMVLAQTGSVTGTMDLADTEIVVSDQEIVDGTVTVDSVTVNAPAWVVIHADEGGEAESIIGFAPVVSGTTSNVVVEIDVAEATETLHAMLHVDAGTVGTYEFPGADVPLVVNGEVVVESFEVTGGLQVTPVVTTTATVTATATSVPATATAAPTVAATSAATVTASVTGTVSATPVTLPTTGGSPIPWSLVVLAMGGLLLVGGLGLALARRS